MRIVGLHHAQITIPRGAEEQAREFYCGVLGLTEIEKPASLRARGGFWLQVGDREVHVGTEDGVDRRKTKAHLAYQVTDLAGWRKKLAEHGISVLESIPIPGYDRFEFRDPFGNRVEMIEQKD
ncbi:glyoxalase/bleomycin resistance protein/dioxygenase superfamily protein [Planifilum fimeticola]|uniref:Glyoxalase/bleomycin resistance protein/dioxygenase superfamily protein n=1 Tax=Planifilum fimeticola TaxID=201975 RepID=A0A2T0LB83_9BACL|nr:glyoxalase/bleomycin resistance protein/dioxygenase superfamily protein [Planifilum fimeticola]